MIETLNGTRETVHHKDHTWLKLYINDECEHYPPHWHNDMEILCPLEGHYSAVVGDVTYSLQVGDILLIGAGTLHDLPAEESGRRIIFQINWSPVSGVHGIDAALSRMQPCCLVTAQTMPLCHDKVHDLLLQICDLYKESPILTEASIYSRAMEMLSLMTRELDERRQNNAASSRSASVRSREVMMELCTYLYEHCSENISLDDAARFTGFSKFYFERLFRDYTGMSFYQYLINRRISLAEQLLADAKLSITEIAYRCGFSSSAAFSKSFRQAKGCSPSQFRIMMSSEVL